jgi:hypothetical protein
MTNEANGTCDFDLEELSRALEDLESDSEIDTVQHYGSDAGFIFVTRGSARVLVTMQVPNPADSTMDDVSSGAHIIRIYTEAVSGLSKLSKIEKLHIYDYLGKLSYNCASARITDDGVLILGTSLPAQLLTPEYCAHVVAEFADFVDSIDSDIAEQYGGLTYLDEGPASEQGRTNHAEY